MKKVLFYLVCLVSSVLTFTSCANDDFSGFIPDNDKELIVEQSPIATITFACGFNDTTATSVPASSKATTRAMAKSASSTNTTFEDLATDIENTICPDYSITLSGVNGTFTYTGRWGDGSSYQIPKGDYLVTGGTTKQDFPLSYQAWIKFNDSISVNDNGRIFLKAKFNCSLVAFKGVNNARYHDSKNDYYFKEKNGYYYILASEDFNTLPGDITYLDSVSTEYTPINKREFQIGKFYTYDMTPQGNGTVTVTTEFGYSVDEMTSGDEL